MKCDHCDSTEGVEMESSRTAYHYTGEPGSADDPNKPVPLCPPCADDHHSYWDSLWDNYYRGLI